MKETESTKNFRVRILQNFSNGIVNLSKKYQRGKNIGNIKMYIKHAK